MADYLNVTEILRDAQERIPEVRKTLSSLIPHVTGASSDVVNIARQNVCASLIRQFQIAEREMRELADMIFTDKSCEKYDSKASPPLGPAILAALSVS